MQSKEMAHLIIEIPDGELDNLANILNKIGGNIVSIEDENIIANTKYFGENIKQAIKAFKK